MQQPARLELEPSDTLVLATGNPKKRVEMMELLVSWPGQIMSLQDFPDLPEVEETGTTFSENAALKACLAAKATGHWALADDSGLLVDALDGQPGVYSARYAGEPSNTARNNAKLLEEMEGVPLPRRTARFACALAVSDPDGVVRCTAEGRCCGVILTAAVGDGGFGYDPLFWIPEYGKTFASLGQNVKSVISHRARAFRGLLRATGLDASGQA